MDCIKINIFLLLIAILVINCNCEKNKTEHRKFPYPFPWPFPRPGPPSPVLVETKTVFLQIVRVPTASGKAQNEFPVVPGRVLSFPFAAGSMSTFNSKITSGSDYFTPEIGRALGTVSATSNTSLHLTGTLSLSDGSIAFNGAFLNFSSSIPSVFSATSGTGRYLGRFGEILVSVVNTTDGGFSVTSRYQINLNIL